MSLRTTMTNMTGKHFLSLLVSLTWLLCLSQGQQVSVVPNKYILTTDDRSVVLNCVSYGLQSNPYNVVVFTVMDKVIYNSSSKELASGTEVINSTAISYSDISKGVMDIGCRINNTVSMLPIAIPYVAQVAFSHTPSGFQYNNSYVLSCLYSIIPNVSNVVVNFSLNQSTFAQYVNMPFQTAIFGTPSRIAGLNVVQGTQGNASNVFIQPTNSSAEGNYQCSVTITATGTSATVNSEIWNTNGSSLLMPSVLLLVLCLTMILCSK